MREGRREISWAIERDDDGKPVRMWWIGTRTYPVGPCQHPETHDVPSYGGHLIRECKRCRFVIVERRRGE